MAQNGDTITYTFSDGESVSEDVSSIDQITVDYLDSSGGGTDGDGNGASGGRVENVKIDTSSHDFIYIWVSGYQDPDAIGNTRNGRYSTTSGAFLQAGGSTEISFSNTNSNDSADEPFLVGGGGGGSFYSSGGQFVQEGSMGGARGGDGYFSDQDGEGTAPPAGGDGANLNDSGSAPTDGDGEIDDQDRGYIIDSGNTIKGGGSSPETNGEVQVSYGVPPPTAPSNLSASVQ